jgi:alkylation response protein AidB-like acyl-CoA dehydrogenase
MSTPLDAVATGDITTTASRFLASQWPLQAEHPVDGVDHADAQHIWRGALGLGWPWILSAEDPVATLRNAPTLAALFTVLGSHPAPLPALGMLVGLPVVAAADASLAPLLDGEVLATTAFHAHESISGGPDWRGVEIVHGCAIGTRTLVAHGGSAESFLVSAHDNGEPVFAVVRFAPESVNVRPLRCYDRLELPADIEFASARADIVCRGHQASTAAAVIAVLETTAVVAELAGIAQGAADLAVAYVKERKQFGRAVGSFQAMKHLLADAWIDVYAVHGVALGLARAVSHATDPTHVLSEAQRALSFAASATQGVCEAALQAHGGIGFTLDYPLNWYFNRMLSRTALAGRLSELRMAIGRDVLDSTRAAAETRTPRGARR